MKFDNNTFLEWTHILFPFYLRQQSRNQNQPQRAQNNFLADYANNRRKRLKRYFERKVKQIGTIAPLLFFKKRRGWGMSFKSSVKIFAR
ncbi:hypothetical protein ACX8XN_15355 [Calditrichota bacterium GD2]